MDDRMKTSKVRGLAAGVNQRGVRNHNERLILSILQRRGGMPGSDLARLTGLSAPAISTILRKLESDGLLIREAPVRGKVGKPSVPMNLNADGALSFGLRIGRRNAKLLLLDIVGDVRTEINLAYDFPVPDTLFAFLKRSLKDISEQLEPDARSRLCGIGIAAPFELWKWRDLRGPEAERFRSWKDIDFEQEVGRFSDLPVYVVNDATAACSAEHMYGRGKEFRDYGYFYIGSFVGGGIVMNNTVFEGNQGNAGALGSMRATGPLGESRQLIDVASLYLLEKRLVEAGIAPDVLWQQPQDWLGLARYVDPWIGETAQELAKASLSVCSVVDFEAILIDGAFPADVREELVERIKRYMVTQDARGLIVPKIEAGSIGQNARGIGAASGPIVSQLFLNTNAGNWFAA